METSALVNCPKVYLQRDYSDGMAVRFEHHFPRELEGRIPREMFEETVSHINQMYGGAEELNCMTFCEGCFACLTSYLFLCCMKTHYEKVAQNVGNYINDQNKDIYQPRGLYIVDPLVRGLRVIEICILNSADSTLTV